MSKTEPSMDEINSVLFDDDTEEMNEGSGVAAAAAKPEPRLLKQKGLSAELESLAPVPANKRPLVQAAIIGVIALPIGWGLVSAFSGGGTTSEPTQQLAAPAEAQAVKRLKTANQEKDQRIKELEVENGLIKQKIEVVPVNPKPASGWATSVPSSI